ncbi:BA75_01009T0 [Komagataella pastoris]|uniref:Mediator of RNA polymerase II transcription subunit 11 n=1 Tax=Komagataella pastoris TaxID=4922 RepID=A0A1B2J8X2_PICPA|nr:BA75_01009T0 [Komagataella pastoris]
MSSEGHLFYIKQRLDSLHDIDSKIAEILRNLANATKKLREGEELASRNEDLPKLAEIKSEFKHYTHNFYENLSDATISLRKEIKLLDNQISGVYHLDSVRKREQSMTKYEHSDITIIPININKKATNLANNKLKQFIKDADLLTDDIDEGMKD